MSEKRLAGEELERLPKWAQVAFAARCARRVQPLFLKLWPTAPQEHIAAIEKAIAISEQTASNAKIYPVETYINIYTAVQVIANETSTADNVAAAAAYAAAAYSTAPNAMYNYSAYSAYATAANAVDDAAVADIVYGDAETNIKAIQAMRRDFEQLCDAAEQRQWTDSTPVPPEFFGSMWPEGELKGWPKSS